jgi:hypothetical protein
MTVLNRRVWLLVGGAWLAGSLWITRFALLDDALIHLRYAEHLQAMHRIAFDGVHTSYGTSSLLYVCILATLRGISHSALLPKVVSVVCYLALIFVTYRLGDVLKQRHVTKFLWVSMLVCLLSPMGIRWLTDGMETSLALLLSATLAILCARLWNRPLTPAHQFTLLLVGALLVMCRVETCTLVFLSGITLAFSPSSSEETLGTKITRPLGLWCGGGLSLLTIWIVFGRIVPDTAVAKSGRPSLAQISGIAHVSISSFELGIGLSVLAAVSGWSLLRALIRQRRAGLSLVGWAAANGSYVLLVIAACVRGQSIEGVRYVLWPLVYAVTWNALVLSGIQAGEQKPVTHSGRVLAWCYGLLVVCLFPFDLYYGMHAMLGRGKAFLQMRSANLQALAGTTIIAGDVGFIGYFSGADICDVGGLVNGPELAALNGSQRYRRCALSQPRAAFLTAEQIKVLAPYLDLSGWRTCLMVDFQNVASDGRHFLMLPANQQRSCQELK